jgi:hypothetical protein
MRHLFASVLGVGAVAASANAGVILNFSDPSGLGAEAEFTLINATTLEVRLKNTSTGVPMGFLSADQLLTGISWEFGGLTSITGGTAFTGPTSSSINFSISDVGPNTSVGGEWGYGNSDGSGALTNFISGNTAGATGFGGANLDGPAGLDGPQAGLATNPALVALGGIAAIQDEIIATVTLKDPIESLYFLEKVRVEFGSDAAFIDVPAPAGAGVLALTALGLRRRAR